MAKMEAMVPHILRWEVGQTKEEIDQKIWDRLTPQQIYYRVKSRGYHNIKGDSGGHTMCGVTLSTLTVWRGLQGKSKPTVEDLRNLGYDEWFEILKNLFWDPCKADLIENDSVAMMLVDWRWVNGTQAVRDAQTVFSLVADGVVGPLTLAALNAVPAEVVFARMKMARLRSYDKITERRPSQQVFYKGWVNRTNSIEFKG